MCGLAYTHMEEAANDLDIPFWAEMYGDVKNSEWCWCADDRPEEGNWFWEVCGTMSVPTWDSRIMATVDASMVELLVQDDSVWPSCRLESLGCGGIIRTTRDVVLRTSR